MGKKAKFGVVTKPKRDKPKKRPGRHKKRRNKHEKRMGKYRGKGRKGRWQTSLDILYSSYGSWVWALIRTAHKYERKKENEKTNKETN